MADPEHLEILKQGVGAWNAWRAKSGSTSPDLSTANLSGSDLNSALLSEVDLERANLASANLENADLASANLVGAFCAGANLRGANLNEANLHGADLLGADLTGANLSWASLMATSLVGAKLRHTNLTGTGFSWANLAKAELCGANLTGASLHGAVLVDADLTDAVLVRCRVHGVSAWKVKTSKGTKQQDLIISAPDEPDITVDNIEVAQFVYLILHNEKIRDVIDSIGRKGVLLLGRFTEGRIAVLDRLRDELRKRDYLPIVFNFDKPETKDFTETVRLLAGLSKFVIADLSGPKSVSYELGAIVSQTMIPFQPIITAGETPFAMLRDLLTSYSDRVFQLIEYPSVDRLIETMDAEIIGPAETRFDELVMRRAEKLKVRRV
jgi:uncharacterized protein YjbI with pentapeptide repeats